MDSIKEARVTLDDIRVEYGNKIAKEIIQAFADEGLNFDWETGWNDYDKITAIRAAYGYYGDPVISIRLAGYDEDIVSEIGEEDLSAIKNMVIKILDTYIAANPYEPLTNNRSIKKPYDVTVKISTMHAGEYSREDRSPEDVLWIGIDLEEAPRKVVHNEPAFNGDTIDDVANGMGKFQPQNTFEIAYCPADVDSSDYYDKFEADKYKRLKINIKYMRVGLSYAGGFKYWDRFQKIKGKDIKKVAGSSNNNYMTSFKLAAEYVPNPNIVLIWASIIGTWDNAGILMERSEFDKMIADLKQLTA